MLRALYLSHALFRFVIPLLSLSSLLYISPSRIGGDVGPRASLLRSTFCEYNACAASRQMHGTILCVDQEHIVVAV